MSLFYAIIGKLGAIPLYRWLSTQYRTVFIYPTAPSFLAFLPEVSAFPSDTPYIFRVSLLRNYIYNTIYTITLHYSYINTLYDTMSLVINAMTSCHCGIPSYLFYTLNYTTPFYKLNTILYG